MIALTDLNTWPAAQFVAALASIFEHSPWVAEQVVSLRPFGSTIDLHRALCEAVTQSGADRQLALIRAHPELAGRAALAGNLTAASAGEQLGAGLSSCSTSQLTRLQALNAQYLARFGFPFVLAVKGHTPDTVIASLAQRVTHDAEEERRVALLEIGRIARFRLAALVDEPTGGAVMAMLHDLATFSDAADALTCAYLTPAHRATADRLRDYMLAAGLDAHIDAVGNVVGVLPGGTARRVLTGSHYDTVIDGGKYDGRLGIVLPIAVAAQLRRTGAQLPFTLEIIGFAEEEGVRFNSTFLGSRALAGRFDLGVLDNLDAAGTSMRDALRAAGHDIASIPRLARDPAQVHSFVEVHIEQGPVLLDAGQPLGAVTAIAGSIRSLVRVSGTPGHAGTVPMALRHDAAAAAAEMILAVERYCRAHGLVGTVGKLEVPGGAMNVIPGRCEFSLDLRSGSDALCNGADADLAAEFRRIAAERGVSIDQARVLETASVQCTPALVSAWAASIERIIGHPAPRLPSGAGHDAMMMANLADIGMLFVRCGNGGISHHPRESLQAADAEVAARVFLDFLQHVETSTCE